MDSIQTFKAACVKNDELDKLDGVVRELPTDSHLGQLLNCLAHTVRAGEDVYVARPSHRVTPAAAAKFLGMSRTHLYKVLDSGDLPYVLVGRDRRISVDDLEAFERRRNAARKNLAERFAHPAEAREAALRELLKRRS